MKSLRSLTVSKASKRRKLGPAYDSYFWIFRGSNLNLCGVVTLHLRFAVLLGSGDNFHGSIMARAVKMSGSSR
jgi:hypothetical protein